MKARINSPFAGNLPPFLCNLLASPPRTGEGVHTWLFKVARQLHVHLPTVEIVRLLERTVSNCGRLVPRGEIVSAVQSSMRCAWHPKDSSPVAGPVSKWPAVDTSKRTEIVRNGKGLADLWEMSSPSLMDDLVHTERIIDQLFPDNPLLCCGKSQFEFDTKPRLDWRGHLSKCQFIVPSPMSAARGRTKEGKQSAHTLENTGARRFLICEFDTGTADDHAAVLLHLGTIAPLVCVVHSGGKSLHGWFYVHGQAEDKILKFFRYAVSLGADKATSTRSQFVRMPDGTRDNGMRQTVFFLNFKPLEAK
jgi:hypothetical protein